MATAPTDAGDLRRLLLAGAPRPLLSRTAEQRLGRRHREVLDGLEEMVLAEGISEFTIGELAARMECSRRTLYELAPSKEQLQLLVLDRLFQRIGREALGAVDPASPIVDQLRQYVTSGIDYAFRASAYDDMADVPAARRLLDRHFRFAATIMERLLTLAIERGEIRPVNATVVAAMISTTAQHLSQGEVIEDLGISVGTALRDMLDALVGGLAWPADR